MARYRQCSPHPAAAASPNLTVPPGGRTTPQRARKPAANYPFSRRAGPRGGARLPPGHPGRWPRPPPGREYICPPTDRQLTRQAARRTGPCGAEHAGAAGVAAGHAGHSAPPLGAGRAAAVLAGGPALGEERTLPKFRARELIARSPYGRGSRPPSSSPAGSATTAPGPAASTTTSRRPAPSRTQRRGTCSSSRSSSRPAASRRTRCGSGSWPS